MIGFLKFLLAMLWFTFIAASITFGMLTILFMVVILPMYCVVARGEYGVAITIWSFVFFIITLIWGTKITEWSEKQITNFLHKEDK